MVEGTGLCHLPLLMCAGGAWHPCCCPAAAAVGSRAILRLARGLSNLSACFLPALFTKPQAWGLGVGCQSALMLGSPRELWFLNTLGQRGPKQHAPQTPLKNFPSPPSVAFRAVPLLSSGVTQDQGKNLCSVPRSWLNVCKRVSLQHLFSPRVRDGAWWCSGGMQGDASAPPGSSSSVPGALAVGSVLLCALCGGRLVEIQLLGLQQNGISPEF